MRLSTAMPHWFDLVTIVVLGIGVYAGRKRGMSDELLRVTEWIVMLFVAARFYHEFGMALANWMEIQPNAAFVMVYLALVIGVKTAFGYLRSLLGEKLVDSDFFGKWEYYLGMAAGMVRYGCALLMALAILSAAYVTEEEMQRHAAFQRENFGSISVPSVGEIQRQIFTVSKAGRIAKSNFRPMLIAAVPPVEYKQEKIRGYGARMEVAVEEALEEPKPPPKPDGN